LTLLGDPNQELRARVQGHVKALYPHLDQQAEGALADRLLAAVAPSGLNAFADPSGGALPGSDEVMLITYGDSFAADDGPHLGALSQFFDDHLHDVFSSVHVLPFSPSSSDGGFAVIDYRRVDPAVGSWADVASLATRARLMFDLVCNHGSTQSEWFADFVANRAPGNDYFVTTDANADVSQVTRPRTHPLLRPTETAAGLRHVWATFSHDQVDFDYSNPDVLVEFCSILGFYVANGASRIRLDAIAYLWKELGTSCIHLPQTHEVVKLMRTLVEAVDPDVLIITETNVPHAENVSYFGDGDEAHVVYNFTLAPLIVSGLIAGSGTALTQWLARLAPPPPGCSFLNFIASHDGIGLRPLEGIVGQDELQTLVDAATEAGGAVSTYATPEGDRPYELNVSLADLLAEADGTSAPRFVLAHALLLSLQGIPAIYVHSLLATAGDMETVARTGHRRDINRPKLSVAAASAQVAAGWRASVFDSLRHLIRVRRTQPAFAPSRSDDPCRPQHDGRTHHRGSWSRRCGQSGNRGSAFWRRDLWARHRTRPVASQMAD